MTHTWVRLIYLRARFARSECADGFPGLVTLNPAG